MAQFDVFRLAEGMLVVDLQTDLIGLEATRIVAPLLDEGRYVAFPGLTPIVIFEGRRWVARVPQLAAITSHALGKPIGDVRDEQEALLRAIDILTHGF